MMEAAWGAEWACLADVVDLGHLRRQTEGDEALAREVLALLAEQLQTLPPSWPAVPPAERRALLHRLKGAASGVGALVLAQKVERMEATEASPGTAADLNAAVAATRAALADYFAAGLSPSR